MGAAGWKISNLTGDTPSFSPVFKTCAMHEISNAKIDIEQRAKTLESDFKQSLTRTTKESEKDYITTYYEKCKAALKEAYDRLRKQEANVMA